nr:L-lactate permease [Bryobacter sp.]
MWQQHYEPVGGSLPLSALVAALPIATLLYLLGVKRTPAWVAGLCGLGTAVLVALAAYGMPVTMVAGAVSYGAAFGMFPIGWIVFWAIILYRITVETGRFEILKDSVGSLTTDRRLQALLIAFAFGAFIEGAAGFGTPVAVAAAMLAGLGFSPFYSAGICLLANTAPVAFGSIGIPVVTLAGITGLPLDRLSADVGRICAPVSLFVPFYLVMVMGGWKAARGAFPAVALCGIAFAGTQFAVSNFVGPQLVDILSSLAAIGSLVLLFRFWQPKDHFAFAEASADAGTPPKHKPNEVFLAWTPYLLLVLFVLL